MTEETDFTDHTCPTGCGRRREIGHLMCSSCWRKVPDHLKRDVNQTWRAYNHRPGGDAAAFRATRRAYFDAREAAIWAVSPAPVVVHHNHVTRSILPRGVCPACDEIHRQSDQRLAKNPTHEEQTR